jgi:hypothetical protein
MSVEEFARFRRSVGERVIEANGVFWRQVRPFFYRPLLQFQEYKPQSVHGPSRAFPGGFQHAVPPHERTNSFLNLLIWDDLTSYSLDNLDRHERREIRRATETFTVLLVTNVNEFKVQAYPVYRSFYERTKYNYKSERRYKDSFSKWADALFQHPKVMVLGAYNTNRELGAIAICCLVEGTLVYSTFFCETKSLKMHVTGFMLHTMRKAAADCQLIKQIFIGNYKYSTANEFYFTRGCKLVSKPAWLQLNPLTAFGLKRFAPVQYDRLIGETEAVESGRIIPPC